jgi:hypothetical protein
MRMIYLTLYNPPVNKLNNFFFYRKQITDRTHNKEYQDMNV